ncbi:hypothetical protein PPL_02609 [Heterostelium album PN500]|uniref:COI1 F-box domain-containing protein n=1 Tax=Heterostelium pallidum (strain ATCC 26659 / Pp 5 / PN500) TaxID=670386 RepID=D3B2J6_HETP5|nr:hypothetical protein PPL_02609 [Heterostelium album PN500]EFA83544.1 hypothetical protein PPL_02609 [Heterostelium album PN500]|eukprot:XP_020435661.1 hypothetical protein PPL_02609 [Heterostelium album PN500]
MNHTRDDNNNNQNSNNIFVKLPFLILNLICKSIDDNIDRVCFSLVCKRWFDNKDKYLLFNHNTLPIRSSKPLDNYVNEHNNNINSTLNSYHSIYLRSLINYKASVVIGSHIFESYDYYYYYLDQLMIYKLECFPTNVTSVDLNLERFIDLSVSNISFNEHLNKMLWSPISNVTELIHCRTLKYKLPPTIKKISFSPRFNEELTPGCFPLGIECITLSRCFNRTIEHGVLPEGLETIEFGSDFQQKIEPGVLPSSLHTLRIGRSQGMSFLKQAGVLPPNLKVLRASGVIVKAGVGVLPTSLHTLSFIPGKWISLFNHLPNLTSLSFFDTHSLIRSPFTFTIDLSLLPITLTFLSLNSTYRLKSAMPQSIKYLYLYQSTINGLIDFNEILPESIQYHFKEFESSYLPTDKTNLKIDKYIQITYNLEPESEGSLFSRDITAESSLNFEIIPYSIKCLKVRLSDLIKRNINANTIETLEIEKTTEKFDLLATPFDVIPLSTRTLIIDSNFQYPLVIPSTLENIIFRDNQNRCTFHIRRLDSFHFIAFGWNANEKKAQIPNSKLKFITKMFHISQFNSLLSFCSLSIQS